MKWNKTVVLRIHVGKKKKSKTYLSKGLSLSHRFFCLASSCQVIFWGAGPGEVEKNIIVALSRQRGPQWANALITMCSNLEGAVRSFIEMVQREGDQLVGILLMGCDWWVVR